MKNNAREIVYSVHTSRGGCVMSISLKDAVESMLAQYKEEGTVKPDVTIVDVVEISPSDFGQLCWRIDLSDDTSFELEVDLPKSAKH
jgi:hypothetical protein